MINPSLLLETCLVLSTTDKHGRLEFDERVRVSCVPSSDTIDLSSNEHASVAEFCLHNAAPLLICVHIASPTRSTR